MLVEFPVITQDDGGLTTELSVTVRLDSIESVMINLKEDRCNVGLVGGDFYIVNMPYDTMIKFWCKALENERNLFIMRPKQEKSLSVN